MRKKLIWLASLLSLALFVAAVAEAQPPGGGQPPGKKGDKGKGKKGGGGGLTADQLVDHLLAYDKKNTGRVTREDLPERIQNLVDLGDVNNDGALDREEIKALSALLQEQGVDAFGQPPPGKGKGKKGGKGKGPGGPGPDGFLKGGKKGGPPGGPDEFGPFGKGKGGKKGGKGGPGPDGFGKGGPPDDFGPFGKGKGGPGGKGKGKGKGDFGPGGDFEFSVSFSSEFRSVDSTVLTCDEQRALLPRR